MKGSWNVTAHLANCGTKPQKSQFCFSNSVVLELAFLNLPSDRDFSTCPTTLAILRELKNCHILRVRKHCPFRQGNSFARNVSLHSTQSLIDQSSERGVWKDESVILHLAATTQTHDLLKACHRKNAVSSLCPEIRGTGWQPLSRIGKASHAVTRLILRSLPPVQTARESAKWSDHYSYFEIYNSQSSVADVVLRRSDCAGEGARERRQRPRRRRGSGMEGTVGKDYGESNRSDYRFISRRRGGVGMGGGRFL